LTKKVLQDIYKVDTDLLFTCLEHTTSIFRPKISTLKTLMCYFDILGNNGQVYDDPSINFCDILEALLEQNSTDKEILDILNRSDVNYEFGKICRAQI
jgi:hypothetical protein